MGQETKLKTKQVRSWGFVIRESVEKSNSEWKWPKFTTHAQNCQRIKRKKEKEEKSANWIKRPSEMLLVFHLKLITIHNNGTFA